MWTPDAFKSREAAGQPRRALVLQRIISALLTPVRAVTAGLNMGGSPTERAYETERARRPQLGDAAFYDKFYGGTEVPRDIPIRHRRLLESILGENLSTLWPGDNIAAIYDGLDFADVIYRIEPEFKVRIPLAENLKPPLTCREGVASQGTIDGTFDSVVRHLARWLKPERPEG